MLTIIKQIFTWWNQQTFGTRLQIFFSGKLIGEDNNGNKYYESKSGRRWVVYNGEVEASKIPNEWYSWMHYPIIQKIIIMPIKKNIKVGKANFLIIVLFFILIFNKAEGDILPKSERIAVLSILDKVSSKNINIKIQVGKELSFQNLKIKVLKCYNSKFDDDPEVTAYMQVKDTSMNNNDKVFVFNDWTFASSPSIKPFDHPVYDVWLKKCYS